MNKKIFGVAFVLYIISAVASYAIFSGKTPVNLVKKTSNYQVPVTEEKVEDPDAFTEPATEECPMNGKMYPTSYKNDWEKRRPAGVMVENHVAARPQSGLSTADIIYEAVAEGGITRFLVIFYCDNADYVGPVRSARMYFIRLAQEYGNNPLYVHVGGAAKEGPADALGELSRIGWQNYNDLDNLGSFGFPYIFRDPERLPVRETEHHVYTGTKKIWDYAENKRKLTNVDEEGVSWDTEFVKWKFADEAAASDRGTVKKISFGFWEQFSSDFSVTWTYDNKRNIYLRENGGKPHVDKNTGKQLYAKNIVIVLADETIVNDGYEHGQHMMYDVLGTGTGYLFQNGKSREITWSKKDATTRMIFTGEDGKEVEFVRGKIFVEVLPSDNKVTF